MSSAAAPAANVTGAQAPAAQRKWTLQQEQIAQEFEQHYGIERRQIGFESDRLEPIFDYDALSVLSLALTDEIVNMVAEPISLADQSGVVTVKCTVTLRDGRTREPFGAAAIGEQMPGGGTIEDFKQALDVAQARAARKGLRAVGFNPLQAHLKRMRGEDTTLNLAHDPHRQQMAEIHLLAQEAGLIAADGDDSAYRKLMGQLFKDERGEPVTTAVRLDDRQRAQFVANLRALTSIKERALGNVGVGAPGALARNAETGERPR